MGTHALLSPSSADRWMTCPGSVQLSSGEPDRVSDAAQEGTNYHDLAQICFRDNKDAAEFVGMPFEDETVVTEENAEYLQVYLNLVRELHAQGGSLVVEEQVPIGQITGEIGDDGKPATGTSDAAIIREDEVVVIDLKFGRGVAVKAQGNRQTRVYALGVIEKHELWDSVKSVRIIICQPRVMDGITEETVTIEELKIFRDEVMAVARPIIKALKTGEQLALAPSEKACQFCRAKAVCPELKKVVFDAVAPASAEGFEDLSQATLVQTLAKNIGGDTADALGKAMALADLCEIYMRGVRSACESELLAGRPVTGFKLVRGKKGNRKWTDPKAVETLMKSSWRLKKADMYEFKLISPTTAEKKFKKEKEGWWKTLAEEYVTQSDGNLTVAPTDDPRPEAVIEDQAAGFEAEVETDVLKELW